MDVDLIPDGFPPVGSAGVDNVGAVVDVVMMMLDEECELSITGVDCPVRRKKSELFRGDPSARDVSISAISSVCLEKSKSMTELASFA